MNLIFKIVFFISLISIEYLATTKQTIKIIQNSWDKLNHSFAFFILYILFSLSYKLTIKYKLSLLLLFGLQIEIIQFFLPYRSFSLLDIFADLIGILVGIIYFEKVCFLKRVKNFNSF